MSGLLDSMQGQFEAMSPQLRAAGGLEAARRHALAKALADGLPAPRSEAWKYTSLRALARREFASPPESKAPDDLLVGIASPRIVFVNGRFDADASRLDQLPPGLRVEPVSRALEGDATDSAASGDDDSPLAFMATEFSGADSVFARLNTALAADGVLVDVVAGQQCLEPLHLVFINAAGADAAWHPRHSIRLAESASLVLVEHHLGAEGPGGLVNSVSSIEVGAGAVLTHARMQLDSDAASSILRSDVRVASGAHYRRVDLELGSGLSRHELNVELAGAGAVLESRGVLLANGRRHLDTRLGIRHSVGDTRCDLRWRGLADERGRVVFHGGIHIAKGADGADAALSNKNLLLSDSAEVDTQPVLVIDADEVKAAHGATVGQLDPQALFYLRSRGIPDREAHALLTAAFCREVVQSGSELLDAELQVALDRRLQRLDLVLP